MICCDTCLYAYAEQWTRPQLTIGLFLYMKVRHHKPKPSPFPSFDPNKWLQVKGYILTTPWFLEQKWYLTSEKQRCRTRSEVGPNKLIKRLIGPSFDIFQCFQSQPIKNILMLTALVIAQVKSTALFPPTGPGQCTIYLRFHRQKLGRVPKYPIQPMLLFWDPANGLPVLLIQLKRVELDILQSTD